MAIRTSSSATCRIFTLLLFGLLWMVGWYTSQMTSQTSLKARSRYYRSSNSTRTSTARLQAPIPPVWEAEDGTLRLAGDLIGEVVDELEKVREVITDSNHGGSSTTIDSTSSNISRTTVLKRLQPVGMSLHSLLLHSVARVSLVEFSAVGIVSAQLREQQGDPVRSCAWVPKASLETALQLATENHSSVAWASSTTIGYVNGSGNSDYDVTVVRCSFEDPVGANSEGGVLLFNVTSTPRLRFEFVPVFQEGPEELSSIQLEGPFRNDYAFCSPPIYGSNMSVKHTREWLVYHQSLWSNRKVHYFIYDAGGISTRLYADVFRPLEDAGSLTIVNLEEALRFGLSQHGQHLAINDCLQRSRLIANWAFFWDFDEYFQVLGPEVSSMDGLLEKYGNKPWISLGNMIWSQTYCDFEADGRWEIERMNFRLKHPTCGDETRANFCHGIEGQRKWIANPRMVFMGTVHRTLDPEWNGEILNASLARLNHFSKLVLEDSSNNCRILKNVQEIDPSTAVDGWWYKDVGFSRAVREARISFKF